MPPSCYSSPDLCGSYISKENFSESSTLTTSEFDTIKTKSNVEIKPHENDILMGRGGKNNQHVGNEKLRQLARIQSENYRVASKKGKSLISRELVRKVRDMNPPGRFLKKDTKTGIWEDVGDDVAREKTSQVLRDAVSILTDKSSSDSCVESSQETLDELSDENSSSVSSPHNDMSLHYPAKRTYWDDFKKYNIPPQNIMSEGYHNSQARFTNTEPPSKRSRYYMDYWDRNVSEWPHYHRTTSIRYPLHKDTKQCYQSSSYPPHQSSSRDKESLASLMGSMYKYAALDEFDLFNGELLNSDVDDDDDDENDEEANIDALPLCI